MSTSTSWGPRETIAADSPIETAAPATTIAKERAIRSASPVTTASAVATIGVMRGATIIAPMTVAVESVTTPPVAMTTLRTSRIPKRTYARVPGSRSK